MDANVEMLFEVGKSFSFKVVLLDNILAAGYGQVPEHKAGGNGQGDCGQQVWGQKEEYSRACLCP
jgi:hypothetical protein